MISKIIKIILLFFFIVMFFLSWWFFEEHSASIEQNERIVTRQDYEFLKSPAFTEINLFNVIRSVDNKELGRENPFSIY